MYSLNMGYFKFVSYGVVMDSAMEKLLKEWTARMATLVILPGWGREVDSTMNSSYCIRNTDNLLNLFCATPILFWASHVEFRTSQSEVHEKKFYVLFNSVDYHDGVHFVAMCKFWNILKKIFLDLYAVENCKRNFVIILKSKTKATFDGVDNLWVKLRKL